MTRSTVSPVPRRTQEQRSQEMRTRLQDATIDCLVEYGYAGATTPRIAERAGVTRGAQVHHFGSKAELMTAAISRLAQRRIEAAMQELGRIQVSSDSVAAVLDFLWELHQGPLFIASVELWVASRTDPALATELKKVEPFVNNAVLMGLSRYTPDEVDRKDAETFLYTAMDALRGILLSAFVDDDPERAHRRWLRACRHLHDAAEAALSGRPAGD
ncbi:TetR/AcrR family transcriptional regulator [Nocardia sp. IBHARD005]|uniref:TetR/AcrR family transcriptional regulator n=1 Tax=Nocardia sp. IBHARD005 TaxID=3457765 RepID=UPI00405A3735